MNDEITNLKEEFKKLKADFEALKNNTTIPLDIENALKIRIVDPLIKFSLVSATAHNKTVNEAGVATYDVMNKPTGFFKIIKSGTEYVIPYF